MITTKDNKELILTDKMIERCELFEKTFSVGMKETKTQSINLEYDYDFIKYCLNMVSKEKFDFSFKTHKDIMTVYSFCDYIAYNNLPLILKDFLWYYRDNNFNEVIEFCDQYNLNDLFFLLVHREYSRWYRSYMELNSDVLNIFEKKINSLKTCSLYNNKDIIDKIVAISLMSTWNQRNKSSFDLFKSLLFFPLSKESLIKLSLVIDKSHLEFVQFEKIEDVKSYNFDI